MIMQDERLCLRRWDISDASVVYEYASVPELGYWCGWKRHTSELESLEIIQTGLMNDETWAITLTKTKQVVGCISLMARANQEAEIGFWMGKPFWGQGIVPHAVMMLLAYGFETLGLEKIWCGYFVGNQNSARVIEKCGFSCDHTVENKEVLGEKRTLILNKMTKAYWKDNKERLENINKR